MSGHGLDTASPTPQRRALIRRMFSFGRSLSGRVASGNSVNAGRDFVSRDVTYNGNVIHNHYATTQRHMEDDSHLATFPTDLLDVNSEIPLPIQKSCDIYSRFLAVKGRGFPLWIPGPSANLHIEYQRSGIIIGDVGILTKSGSFDFVFNICLPKNHPINDAGVPDGFYPLHIPRSDILRYNEFDAGSYVASSFVEKTHYNDTFLANGLAFESSAREGAILTMPCGAMSQDLACIVRFEDYMAQHMEYWYKFIIEVRGRKISNGDVRLVIGTDMAPVWGMASFSQSYTRSSPLQLRFKATGINPVGPTYGWEYSGVADTKCGPSYAEMQRLRSDDNADALGTRYNQSLFVRSMTATLGDTLWDEFMSSINSTRISARTNVYSRLGTSSGTSSVTSNEDTTTWTRVNDLVGHSFVTSTTAQAEPSLYIVGDTTNTIAHPSNKINDLLIKMVQDNFPNEAPRMVITKDQDWISVLDKNDLVLPSGEELYRRIMDAGTFQLSITNNGVLYLESAHENTSNSGPTEIQVPNFNLDGVPRRMESPHQTRLDEKLSALQITATTHSSDRDRVVEISARAHSLPNLLQARERFPSLSAVLSLTKIQPSPTTLRHAPPHILSRKAYNP